MGDPLYTACYRAMTFNNCIRFYKSKNATKCLPETKMDVPVPETGLEPPENLTNFNSCGAIKFGGN
jgi:hypothetical protein